MQKGGSHVPTDMELKIALVDSVESDREMIGGMVREYLKGLGVACSVSTYTGAEAFLEDIRGGRRFNLLLTDVMLEEMSGMDLAVELRRQKNNVLLVFISANREMALRGYEVSAARYLAKPLEQGKLEEALGYCYRRWQEKKEILLPTDHGQYRISYSDIEFVEAFERGTKFVLVGETVDSKLKFSEVESILPRTTFIHCHRAYIVNVAHVRRLRPNTFEMRSGATVPVSKHRYGEVSRRFFDFIAD